MINDGKVSAENKVGARRKVKKREEKLSSSAKHKPCGTKRICQDANMSLREGTSTV